MGKPTPLPLIGRLFLGAWLLGPLVVSWGCGSDRTIDPPDPPAGPSGGPTVKAVSIVGPSSVQPGSSPQFSATVQLSDGTERTGLGARWSSSNPAVLFINATTGTVSTHPAIWGEGTLSVEVSLAGTGLTGQNRSSREIFVMPEGTFRMVGIVTEVGSPGQGIRDAALEIRVTDDLSSPVVARTGTDSTGRYRLYGVPPESYLLVRRGGYLPVTERVQVSGHTTRDFQLRLDGNVPSFEGTFTMTVDASNCSGFSKLLDVQYRLRTYTATIAQSGSRLTVRLSGASLHANSDGFSGIASPTGADMQLRSFYNAYYYPDYLPQPDVAERLADGTFVETSGAARLSGTPDRLSGTASMMRRWSAFQGPGFLGGCQEPRITMTRR